MDGVLPNALSEPPISFSDHLDPLKLREVAGMKKQPERGNAAEANEAKRLAARMAERALRLGGTVTGEHGIGIGKLAYMQAEHGAGWAVMGAIKRALDPLNILNPGKLVPQ